MIWRATSLPLFTSCVAALLHDVKDYKYSGSEHAQEEAIREFLLRQHFPAEKSDKVVRIVKGVGFKGELKAAARFPFSLESMSFPNYFRRQKYSQSSLSCRTRIGPLLSSAPPSPHGFLAGLMPLGP